MLIRQTARRNNHRSLFVCSLLTALLFFTILAGSQEETISPDTRNSASSVSATPAIINAENPVSTQAEAQQIDSALDTATANTEELIQEEPVILERTVIALEAPSLLHPPDNSIFTKNPSIFDWADVENAQRYELNLTYPNDYSRTFNIPPPAPQPSPSYGFFERFTNAIFNLFRIVFTGATGYAVADTTISSSFVISNELWASMPHGKYIWKVKAIDINNQEGPYSKEHTFYKELPQQEPKKIKKAEAAFERTKRETVPPLILNAYYSSNNKQEFIDNFDSLVAEYQFADKIDKRLANRTFLESENYITQDNKIPVIILLNENRQFSDPAIIKKREFKLINAVSAEISQNDVSWIASSDSVKGIYLNQKLSLPEPLGEETKETLEPDNRNELINANYAWNLDYKGAGIKIAILDTGVDKNHPDLQGKVIAEASFVPDSFPKDGHGHGTHVASLAAGTGQATNGMYAGVATEALIMNGKVLDDEGSGYTEWIIAGIEWAVDNNADVISMSLGGDPTEGLNAPLTEAVNKAFESGVVVVIAAGNSGWY